MGAKGSSMKKVVIGMSGGVDSSVAAWLLKQQGYDVIGVTMQMWSQDELYSGAGNKDTACKETENKPKESILADNVREKTPLTNIVQDAKKVADVIGIPHVVLDFREVFREKVVNNFVNEYLRARTPNPCIVCNRFVKWEALLDYGKKIGAGCISTGHYANIKKQDNGRFAICASGAKDKDQTYALYRLTQDQLAAAVFPLACLTKPQIREIAKSAGLPVAEKKDSQEICFIPDKDYARFIENYTGRVSEPGNFVTADGTILGRHKGLIHYTIGQRRGLGLPMGRRVFVSELRPETNEVVIAEGNEVFSRIVRADQVNFMGISKEEFPVFDDRGLEEAEIISFMQEETAAKTQCIETQEDCAAKTPKDAKETSPKVSAAAPSSILHFTGKIRYNHKGAPCTAYRSGPDEITAVFDEPVRAAAKGQALVLYNNEGILMAGGTIK